MSGRREFAGWGLAWRELAGAGEPLGDRPLGAGPRLEVRLPAPGEWRACLADVRADEFRLPT